MSVSDVNFPILHFENTRTPAQWGQQHGESFRAAIGELAEIRKELMLQKNPALKDQLDELAQEQIMFTQMMSPALFEEFEGLQKASNLSATDLVILNNYTDFRDIQLEDQGCTTVFMKHGLESVAAQTWDMHESAKRFLCVLNIDKGPSRPAQLVLSLVGCLGMMGINQSGVFVGVNNINTTNARPGVIWPMLVRHALTHKQRSAAVAALEAAPVTSGHNYLVADESEAGHYEVSPGIFEQVGKLTKKDGLIFHTNHCLGALHQEVEDELSTNSTTFERYEIVKNHKPNCKSAQDIMDLLKSHEGHPKSICSHFQNGTQDPSATCGAGLVDYHRKSVTLWRGCETYDKNFIQHQFAFPSDGLAHFQQIKA